MGVCDSADEILCGMGIEWADWSRSAGLEGRPTITDFRYYATRSYHRTSDRSFWSRL
jgi:hypothetical protein